MESITDWLISQGFKENQTTDCFERSSMNGNCWVTIPFSVISGHTLDSFRKLADRKGWGKQEEVPADTIWTSGYPNGIFFAGVNAAQFVDTIGPLVEPWHDPSYKRIRVNGPIFQATFPVATQKWKMRSWFVANASQGGQIVVYSNRDTEGHEYNAHILPGDCLHLDGKIEF